MARSCLSPATCRTSLTTIAKRPPPQWRYSGGSYFGGIQRSLIPIPSGLLWRDRRTGDISRWLLNTNGTLHQNDFIGAGNAMPPTLDLIAY